MSPGLRKPTMTITTWFEAKGYVFQSYPDAPGGLQMWTTSTYQHVRDFYQILSVPYRGDPQGYAQWDASPRVKMEVMHEELGR
jgi:hypothetical protein